MAETTTGALETTRTGEPGYDPFAATIPPPSGRLQQRPPARLDTALANGLGWFSIGLGLTQLLFPEALSRWIGIHRPRPLLVRLCGAREVVTGLGVLSRRRPAGALWSRVVGDALDLSLLGAALEAPRNDRTKLARATAAVAAVTLLDAVAAARMTVNAAGLRSVRVVKSIAVNRSPMECYAFWRNLENVPFFMANVRAVHPKDERRSRWLTRGVAGTTLEWNAELTRDEPGALIAWRSVGGDIDTQGAVEFAPRPGRRGTLVRVAMEYAPPAGAVGALVGRLFMVAPEQQLKTDLRRFKQILETGELTTTQGQPAGRRSLGHRALARYTTGGEA